MNSDIDFSQDLILMFAPRVSETISTVTNATTGETKDYIYRHAMDTKLSKLQAYYYFHPREYSDIIDLLYSVDPVTDKPYKLKDISWKMQLATGSSNILCENELRRIMAERNITKAPRQKATKFELHYKEHPDHFDVFKQWSTMTNPDTGKLYTIKETAASICNITGFSDITCIKEIRRIRRDFEALLRVADEVQTTE